MAQTGSIPVSKSSQNRHTWEALLRGDTDFLTLQRVGALLEIVPTEQELSRVTE